MGFLIFHNAFAVSAESSADEALSKNTKVELWVAGFASLFANVRGKSRVLDTILNCSKQILSKPQQAFDCFMKKGAHDAPKGSGSRFQDISALESHLWSKVERRMLPALNQGRVCIMGFDKSTSELIVDYLETASSLNAFSVGIHGILDIAAIHETVSILVVNGDAIGDLFSTVDALRNFREIRPNMSVVLVSSKVSSDDLSDERKAICDATLRAPITMSRLGVAIKATVDKKSDGKAQDKESTLQVSGKIVMFPRGTGGASTGCQLIYREK